MRITNDHTTTRHVGAGRPNKYPFYDLQPGQMLSIPVEQKDSHKRAINRISTALTSWKKREGHTYVTAVRTAEVEPKKWEIRVYRVN